MPTNVFETGSRKVIPAVLVYIEREDDVLMLYRNAKPGDYHAGKYNGLGGKLEADESPREAAAREVLEEAGIALDPSAFRSLGFLQFPNFKAHKSEDWIVFVLMARVTASVEAWSSGPEGDLKWVPKRDLLKLNVWEGDRYFLNYVAQGRPFAGTIWYNDQVVAKHSIEVLGIDTS